MMTNERTLVAIKPDGMKNVDEIVKIIEAIKHAWIIKKVLIYPSSATLRGHYNKDREWIEKVGKRTIEEMRALGLPVDGLNPIDVGYDVYTNMIEYMNSGGELLFMIVVGENIIARMRSLLGATEPISAQEGTIRRMFSDDSFEQALRENRAVRNVAHCSEDKQEAEREIAVWGLDG